MGWGGEVWRDVGRCGEVLGEVGSHGEVVRGHALPALRCTPHPRCSEGHLAPAARASSAKREQAEQCAGVNVNAPV